MHVKSIRDQRPAQNSRPSDVHEDRYLERPLIPEIQSYSIRSTMKTQQHIDRNLKECFVKTHAEIGSPTQVIHEWISSMLVRPHQVKSILFPAFRDQVLRTWFTWRKDACFNIYFTNTTWKNCFENIPEFDKAMNALDFLPIVAGIGAFLMTRTRSQHWCFIGGCNRSRLLLIFKLFKQ